MESNSNSGGYSTDQLYFLVGKLYTDLYHSSEFAKQVHTINQEKDNVIKEHTKTINELKIKEGLQIKRIESLLKEKECELNAKAESSSETSQ